jgi:hypothetical protein
MSMSVRVFHHRAAPGNSQACPCKSIFVEWNLARATGVIGKLPTTSVDAPRGRIGILLAAKWPRPSKPGGASSNECASSLSEGLRAWAGAEALIRNGGEQRASGGLAPLCYRVRKPSAISCVVEIVARLSARVGSSGGSLSATLATLGKVLFMVALAVRYCGQKPVTCNSRAMLFRAHADLEAGKLIEAGCRLREAVRLFLVAELTYWDCMPKKKHDHTPRRLLVALNKAGQCGDGVMEWINELLDIGNKLAHCGHVRRGLVECAISMAHSLLDGSPYLVQPVAAGRLS